MKKIERCINSYLLIFICSLFSLAGFYPIQSESKPGSQTIINSEKAAQLNVQLGLAYLKADQLHRAKLKLNRAMKLAPKLSEVHYGMAFYFERVGESQAARQAYQRSIALKPKGGLEHHYYGAFLYKQQEYKASEKEFVQALRDPDYMEVAQSLENAGLCALAMKDNPKAIAYFKRALGHDSKRSCAVLELAYLYYLKGELDSAAQYYEHYTKLAKPTDRSLWLGEQLANKLIRTSPPPTFERV